MVAKMQPPRFSAESSVYRTAVHYSAGFSSTRGVRQPPFGGSNPCPPIGCHTCQIERAKCCYSFGSIGCSFGTCAPTNYTCCNSYYNNGQFWDNEGAANLQTDPNNCGKCSYHCAPGSICCNGVCTTQSSGSCGCPPKSCSPGQSCCSGTCVNTSTDPRNCGACAHYCPPGQQCIQGVCCPAGSTVCANGMCCDNICHKCIGGSCAPAPDGTPCPHGVCCGGNCTACCGIGAGCSTGGGCCTGWCNRNNQCDCFTIGDDCRFGPQSCCSGLCSAQGQCCLSISAGCTSNSDCCSGWCNENNQCDCFTTGDECRFGPQSCCSGQCSPIDSTCV